MSDYPAISAEALESAFGESGAAARFANFCNTVVIIESTGPLPSLPILSEKPGPDGSFDGEWDLTGPATGFSSPFAEAGWSLFQFKSRGITGSGRKKAVSDLRRNLRGTLLDLVERLKARKEPKRYTLFTNLQLGLETPSTTERDAVISKDRAEIEAAIREGCSNPTAIHVVDAAQLAALVNKHPALRLTYFTPSVAKTWDEKWREEQSAKDYKVSAPLIGRDKEIERVQAWLADPTIKVIAICGPSGMGKTRLALEGTRPHQCQTTVVEVVEELERLGVKSLGSSPQTRFVVVEDPTEAQATRLTKEALNATGLKLIFTFPSEARTPRLKLTEHESVKQIILQPLDRDSSRKLLETAGTSFDGAARDWVIQQAGGVPEILLSAAELGLSLRDKSGDLKRRLADIYRRRIEKELGAPSIGILRAISPLHWVKVHGQSPDLSELLTTIGPRTDPITALTQIKSLEAMGYLRHRGDYVSVVPPVFAAALAEEVFAADLRGVCGLFDRLNDDPRKRLLERVVTVDLPDQSPFWDHVFESALGTTERIIANLDLLDYLARAIPFRTGQFLEAHIGPLADAIGVDEHNWRRSNLLSTVRELAYQQESCAIGMRLLQHIALREPWRKDLQSATQLFCECFVHWYTDFPLSFQERERWIHQMLKSEDVNERRLAARVVAIITDPPRTLSGHSVNARKLGQAPVRRFYQEVWDYIDHAFQLRFELTQDTDSITASVVREHFVRAFEEMFLPADRLLTELKKFMQWQRDGRLQEDEREIRRVLGWIEGRLTDASKKPEQAEHAAKWSTVLHELATLRQQIDDGPFELRLKVGLGRAFDHSWVEVNGKREYGFERRCRELANEVVATPQLMTEGAWAMLRDPQSSQAWTFIIALGASDMKASFLPRLLAEAIDDHGARNLGLYLVGLQQHNAALVETQLAGLDANPDFPKALLLTPITLTGPTPTNRQLLLRLIADRTVEPAAVGQMFTMGRWLEPLPTAEIRQVLEFIATGPPDWPRLMIHIVSLYLHPAKPLATDLIPVAERALKAVQAADDSVDWDCGHVAAGIAKTDIDKAVQLLQDRIEAFRDMDRLSRSVRETWLPLRSYGAMDFWEFLRNQVPEKAYGALLSLRDTECRSELGLLLDLENHRTVLLGLANTDQKTALFYSSLVSGAQAGFFPFAYGLMDAFPNNEQISRNLASAAVYGLGFGADDANYNPALARVETELKSAATPQRFMAWLQAIKDRLNENLRSSELRRQKEPYLGWD